MRFRNIYFFLLGLFSYCTFSADFLSIKREFAVDYFNHYEEGQCGKNINNFLHRLVKAQIDVSGVLLVSVQGGGDIWAYATRTNGLDPSRSVWFHHYIMLIPQGEINDLWDLKQEIMNYYVIDFDFLNQPTIIPFKEYLEHMFMTKSLKNNKEKILKDLNLSLMSFDIVDAGKYVLFSKNGQSELSLTQKKQVILAEGLKFRDIYIF